MRPLSPLLPFRFARSQPTLRVTRFYSTKDGANDGGVHGVKSGEPASRERPPLISTELLEEASRSIDMEEVYADAISMERDLDPTAAPSLEHVYDLDSTLEEFRGDDSTSLGHHMLRSRREILEYFRLIELELPSLQGTPCIGFFFLHL